MLSNLSLNIEISWKHGHPYREPQHHKDVDISNVSQISVCLDVCYYVSNGRITMGKGQRVKQ